MRYSVLACDARLSSDFPFILRGDYASCARMAHEIGFEGIEIQIKDPTDYNWQQMHRDFQNCQIEIPSINTGLAYTMEGLSMTDTDESRRLLAVERLKRHADMAAALDSRVLIGFIRGRKHPEDTDESYVDRLADSMYRLVEYGEQVGAPIVFEQINRRDGDIFNATGRTMEFVESFHSDYLLYNGDTYHMLSEDNDIEEAITRSIRKLILFHVSDEGRLLPDDQHFDFQTAAVTLKKLDYQGWCTLECKPLPDSATAARVGYQYLERVFGRKRAG